MAATLEVSSIAPQTGVFTNSHFVMRTGLPREHSSSTAEQGMARAQVFLDAILAFRFASRLPTDPRVEQVRWKVERGQLRIWTVIRTRDEALQNAIYDAELNLIENIGGAPVDLAVVYRGEQRLEDVVPAGTFLLQR